jgi:DNA-binding Lrp family transcriptional regulator
MGRGGGTVAKKGGQKRAPMEGEVGIEVLRLLEKNARARPEEIAAMLGVEEGEVKRRIQKYEKEGVILRYKTAIHWEKVGEDPVYAMIDVKVTPERGRGYDSVAERIMRFPEVLTLYLISGSYDLSVLVRGKSIKEVAAFVAEKLAPLERVQSTATHFLLKKYKEDGDILIDTEEAKRLAITL